MNNQLKAASILALGILAAGSAWPAIKYGLAEATPVWYAVGRAVISAATGFALLAALGRLKRPTRADLPIIITVGALQLCLFFTLINLGLALLPAGRSVILAYTTTLWVVPLAGPLLGERPRARQLAGVVLGIAGIALLLAPAFDQMRDAGVGALAGYLYLLGAALAWALAILHSRGHRWNLSPLQVMPWQMLFAAVLLVPVAFVLEPHGHIETTARALVPLAYLGVLAGPIITWSSTTVSRLIPAVAVSLGYLLTPVMGVAISALFLGEPVGFDLVIGGVLVLLGAGVAIAAGRR
jgi:drug/metabolite transporter (DMT)-like permease